MAHQYKQLHIRIPIELHELLRKSAFHSRVSINSLVRLILVVGSYHYGGENGIYDLNLLREQADHYVNTLG
jgi:hypothetical protein